MASSTVCTLTCQLFCLQELQCPQYLAPATPPTIPSPADGQVWQQRRVVMKRTTATTARMAQLTATLETAARLHTVGGERVARRMTAGPISHQLPSAANVLLQGRHHDTPLTSFRMQTTCRLPSTVDILLSGSNLATPLTHLKKKSKRRKKKQNIRQKKKVSVEKTVKKSW